MSNAAILSLLPAEPAAGMNQLRVPSALAGLLQVPSDALGRLLALGYLGLLLLGLAGLLAGNPLAALFVGAALLGWVFLEGRLVALAVWALAAAAGLVGALLGDTADWLLTLLAGGLLVASVVRILPSAGLRRDHGQAAPSDAAQQATGPGPLSSQAEPVGSTTESGLAIQTLGRFAISQGPQDLTPALLDRPVLNFVWTYLLARAILTPGDRLTRLALADEVSPGLPQSEQRRRLRSLIYDLQHDLPSALAARVLVEGQSIGLDLEGCAVDVIRLAGAAESVSGALLAPAAIGHLERLLAEVGQGDFLTHFQELEERITGARGSAMNVIQALRSCIDGWRAQLVASLADTYLARQDYERCVRLLEPALSTGLATEQLARRLVNAYLRSGRSTEAGQLSRRYALALEG